MLRKLMTGAAALAVLTLSNFAFAQAQFGTEAEAPAMLEKWIAAVKVDKAKALDMMQKGGFRDRDLYVYCVNASDISDQVCGVGYYKYWPSYP